MSQIFPANRIAAIAGFLTGLGALITSIEGALPSTWQNAAVGLAGLITSALTVLHFMSGSQKYDALVTAKAPDRRGSPVISPGTGFVMGDPSAPAAEHVLAEIQAVADAQAAFQAKPSPGAADPPHGLAPDTPPTPPTPITPAA